MSTAASRPPQPSRLPRARPQVAGATSTGALDPSSSRRLPTSALTIPRRAPPSAVGLSAIPGSSRVPSLSAIVGSGETADGDARLDPSADSRVSSALRAARPSTAQRSDVGQLRRRLSRPDDSDDDGDNTTDEQRRRSFARRRSDHLAPPRSRSQVPPRSFNLSSSSEDDELEVLAQLTPRVSRTRPDLGPTITRPDPLARFRARPGVATSSRASLPSSLAPGTRVGSRQSSGSARRDADSLLRRRSLPDGPAGSVDVATGSRGTNSFVTANDQPRHQVSFQGVDGPEDQTVSSASMTMSNPRQRLRPSLTGSDGRLDVPNVEERCAALATIAKAVLGFYMKLQRQGWQDDSFDEMLRSWPPFEMYKTNQLLDQGQYNHHFIDVAEVLKSVQLDAEHPPSGIEEAMRMANCATFVHYIHQIPDQIDAYGPLEDGKVTSAVLSRAPLRNINELNDARRIFLRWMVPPERPLTDEVFTLLLDISTQLFIYRLQRNVESVQAGTLEEVEARAVTASSLDDLSSGEIVRYSLRRVQVRRGMGNGEINEAIRRYETFANIRKADLQDLLYDHVAMAQKWPFLSMVRDLTSYIRDVVREVDNDLHSTSLAEIMSRLERESLRSSSELAEEFGTNSVLDGDTDVDQQSVLGPSQSTPKADAAARTSGIDVQAFASQFPNWIQEMIEDEELSRSNAAGSQRPDVREESGDLSSHLLTVSQKEAALAELLMEEDEPSMLQHQAPSVANTSASALLPAQDEEQMARSSSVDLGMRSSPPAGSSLFRAQASARDASGSQRQLDVTPSAAGQRSGRATSTRNRSRRINNDRSEDAGDETARGKPGRPEDVMDSPTKEKASRLGFDSQNRLVRKAPDTRKGRLLDGSTSAVRESRFDSQGEDEEDIFLENATKKRKAKGKQRAQDVPSDATFEAPPSSVRRSTRASVKDQAAQSSTGETDSGAPAQSVQVKEEPENLKTPRRSSRRTRQGSEPTSVIGPTPTRRSRRTRSRAETAEAAANGRADEARPATIEEEPQQAEDDGRNEELVDVGTGRNTRNSRAAAARMATATDRPSEANEDLPPNATEHDAVTATTFAGERPADVEMDPLELTQDHADEFEGDDDPDVLSRRAARDEAIARRPPRPGTEKFHLPRSSGRAVLQFAPADEVERSRDAARVTDVLRPTQTSQKKRIGPYRPEGAASALSDADGADEEARPPRRGRARADAAAAAAAARAADDEELDELWSPERELSASHLTRVEPYKRSNLYITGGNMVGRQHWTEAETACLLKALYQIARYKRHKPRFRVYSKVLQLHGKKGTRSKTLARWNNVQLKDKSRNELIRMKRERVKIPYWKGLLHPNLWEPKPERGKGSGADGVDLGDETEQVPSEDEIDDDESEREEQDEVQGGSDAEEGGEGREDLDAASSVAAEVADEAVADGQEAT